jgi:hypothetical protein
VTFGQTLGIKFAMALQFVASHERSATWSLWMNERSRNRNWLWMGYRVPPFATIVDVEQGAGADA